MNLRVNESKMKSNQSFLLMKSQISTIKLRLNFKRSETKNFFLNCTYYIEPKSWSNSITIELMIKILFMIIQKWIIILTMEKVLKWSQLFKVVIYYWSLLVWGI